MHGATRHHHYHTIYSCKRRCEILLWAQRRHHLQGQLSAMTAEPLVGTPLVCPTGRMGCALPVVLAGISAGLSDTIYPMDTTIQTNNKRIAKNTAALCARMFLTIAIGIYSSRLVLEALGVTDYGVYSVVGGIVSFFVFLNASLANGAQRFLNFYMGRGDGAALSRVFSTSVYIFVLLAILILVLGETVGVAVVNWVLDIPPGRRLAANVVCQFTILATIIDVLSLPYNALIIAYERMGVFAYVSVAQSVATLAAALALSVLPGDRLITYAILSCVIMVMVRMFYGWYCARHFAIRATRSGVSRTLFREMLSFSGWTLTGSFAYVTYMQGIPILLNLFFGPVVNAANALAQQVNASLSTFSANFMMAAKPQITKYYAEGNAAAMQSLVFYSSKLSVLIMLMVSLPFIVMPDYLLGLWLVEVPAHTAAMLRLIMWASVINALSMPVNTAIQATGRVRSYQVAEAVALLLAFPLTYVVFALGGAPEGAYLVLAMVFALAQAVRIYFMATELQVSVTTYLYRVVGSLAVFAVAAYMAVVAVHASVGDSLGGLACVLTAIALAVPALFVVLCMNRAERATLWGYIKHIRS